MLYYKLLETYSDCGGKTNFENIIPTNFYISSIATILLQSLESWRITMLRQTVESDTEGCHILAKKEGLLPLSRKMSITRDPRLSSFLKECQAIEELLSTALQSASNSEFSTFEKYIREKYSEYETTELFHKRDAMSITHTRSVRDVASGEVLPQKEAIMSTSIEDEYVKDEIEYRLVKNWEAARVDQQKELYARKEKVIYDDIERHRARINMETYFKDQHIFLDSLTDTWTESLDEWSKMYESKVEELDNEHQYLVSVIRNTELKFENLQEIYAEREEYLLMRRKTKSARKIQIWWRHILQTRKLLKKKSKKGMKGKQAKKKGGKK